MPVAPETFATPDTRVGQPLKPVNERSSPRIGAYRVLGTLGRGGMGVVYEALDEQLGRKVAIKQLRRPDQGVRGYERSLREGQALARLAHPNVVTVHEVFEADGQLCIVMELVAGLTLRAWLSEQRPNRAEILAALIQAGRGIAAAHAAGIVHRDLKPDNIMIGDDGRVRVMDFGLARATDMLELDGEHEQPPSGPIEREDLLATPVTVVGAVLGTPGYMAPEQYLGQAIDERSDLFSFCVVAFEALLGRRPFVGGDEDIRAATLDGRIEPVAHASLPGWLDAVIRRGLAREPDQRWPDMNALLDALARDPVGRRRRILRGVGLAALAGALAAGSAVAIMRYQAAREQARIEQAAADRLTAVEAAIARAEAEGDHEGAEAAFRAYVSDPAHQHTRALVQAWQRRGERLRDDPAAAQAAFAEAYVRAREPEDAITALRSIAAGFHASWSASSLERTLGLLIARGDDDPALADMALDAALWQRDLSAALVVLDNDEHPRAHLRPLLEQLVGSRELPVPAIGVVALPPGGPARFAIHGWAAREVVLLDANLAELDRIATGGTPRLIPSTSWAMAEQGPETAVLDLLAGGRELGRLSSPVPIAIGLPVELGGDARPELIISRLWPAYGFRRWDLFGAELGERVIHGETEALESSLAGGVVADLDGDGVDEFVVAIGPWHGFELRVFHVRDGGLELLARERVGAMPDLALVRRGDRPAIAVFVDDSAPAPELFPEPPHVGGPPGLHLFEWTGAALDEVEFVPLPTGDHVPDFLGQPKTTAGDLDGDGLEDLAVTLQAGDENWLLLARQTAGGFEPAYVYGLRAAGAAQLDDDPGVELFVSVDFPGERRGMVLGLGEATLPHVRTPPATTPAPLASGDPLIAERWARANELAELGLSESAALSLVDAATLASDERERALLLDRAAALFETLGADERVLALAQQLRRDPSLAAEAGLRGARALVRLGRYDEALAEARTIQASASASPAQVERAAALVAELEPLAANGRVDLDFAAPLSSSWRLRSPGALRHDPTRAALEFELSSASGPVAELPLRWSGGPVALELELELEQLEFDACVRVALVDARDQPWLGGGICGMGGGGRLLHSGRLKHGPGAWIELPEREVGSVAHPRRVLMRVAYFPERGSTELTIDDGDERRVTTMTSRWTAEAGPQRLVIGTFVDSGSTNLARGWLRRIALRGVVAREAASEGEFDDRPLHLLAGNDPLAALAALDEAELPVPHADTLRMLALADLGDLDGLLAAAPAMLARLDDPRWAADFALALRARPLVGAALRRAAGAAILPVLAKVWALAHEHRNDPVMQGRVLDELEGVERTSPAQADQRVALRALLAIRGRTWKTLGDRERARRDFDLALAMASSSAAEDQQIAELRGERASI